MREYREKYLDAVLEAEGRGRLWGPTDECSLCGSDGGLYRCQECFGSEHFCKGCILSIHKRHPFHIPQVPSHRAYNSAY